MPDSLVLCDPGATTLEHADRLSTRIHNELAGNDPYELDVAQLEILSCLSGAEGKLIRGVDIYEQLKKEKLLWRCLGYAEILAIEFKGNSFHDKYFNGKRVVGWKDAVLRLRDHQILVPFVDKGINVFHGWMWLGGELRVNAPTYLKRQ